MKNTIRFALAAAVSLVALEASAGGFFVREQSATLQGMSFAGEGTSSGGLSSMFWNPAAMTANQGINFDSHYSLILPYASFAPTTGSGAFTATRPGSGNIGQPAFVPASYASFQLNEQLWAGISVNSPFGLKTKSDFYWAGQYYGRSSKATDIDVTPSVAYKVNDWLSVGAGLQISHLGVSLKGATPPVAGLAGVIGLFGPNAPSNELAGKGWGAGYTLGATIRPFSMTEISLGFRSAVRYELAGHLQTATSGRSSIRTHVATPESLTLGIRQEINNQFAVLGTLEWTNWSRVRNAPITLEGLGRPVSSLAFYYDDSWMFALGGEYKYNQQLTLRAGVAYELSPVSDAVRSVRIPDNDRLWASLGATYKWNEKLQMDIGYSHIFVKNPNINLADGNPQYNPALTANSALVANGKAHVDIISFGIRYRFDEPAKPASSSIIRKG